MKHTHQYATFLILDFGSNSLLPLKTLPHTSDTLTLDDDEALEKLHRLLLKEMKRRKDILGQSRVSSISLHNRVSPDNLIPAQFIFIDNIDPLREHENPLELLIRDISREGQALSIYLIYTATRPSAVRHTISANMKNNILFHMTDRSDVTSLLGRTELQSEHIPGRGLIRTDTVCSFQAALPTYGDYEEARVHTLQEALQDVREAWQGPLPLPIPMTPAILPLQDFYQTPSVIDTLNTQDKCLPIALDDETLGAFSLDFGQISHLNIIGTNNIGKTNLVKVLLQSLARKAKHFILYIADDSLLKLSGCQEQFPNCLYLTSPKEFHTLLQTQAEAVKKRRDTFAEKMKARSAFSPAQYYNTLTPHLIIINNIANFLAPFTPAQHMELANLIEEAKLTGVHFCFVSNSVDYPKTFDKLPNALRNISTGITLIPLAQTPILPVPVRVIAPRPLKPGEAFYIQSGTATLIKVPLVSGSK
jgi:S-DNA-T family DNA segregation ATPase FtsK/SpoIIIE